MLPVLVMSALLLQYAPALPAVAPPAVSSPAASAPAVTPAVQAPVAAAPTVAAPAPVVQTPTPPPPAAPQTPAKPSMIKVDAYHESAGDRTDSGIWSAFNAKQSQSGPMEGTWIVASSDGRKLVSLELRSDASTQRLEGAWRSLTKDTGLTGAGFVSDLFLDGPDMEINYAAGRTQTPNVLELRKMADGQWRGFLLDPTGRKTDVTMSQAVHAG